MSGMSSTIANRIERESGLAGLVECLSSRLPPSDLRSLLMEVYRVRAEGVTEAGIRAQADRDALMAPSAVDARLFLSFDTVLFQAAADFAGIDLSPVSP